MIFADGHNHSLFGCDDGAKNEEEMKKMIDNSYLSGVRYLCFTPHFSPLNFGDNREKVNFAFNRAIEYIKSKYVDFLVAIGNELRYNGKGSFSSYLSRGLCKTMNGTKYVLIDFVYNESFENICNALDDFMQTGFIPILAHAERYEKLITKINFFNEYKSKGLIIQINANSISGDYGAKAKFLAKKLLSKHLADIISSDTHNLTSRPPDMNRAYAVVSKKYGEDYAEKLFCENLKNLIF